MKKIILIFTLSFLLTPNSFSASKEMEKILFTGCYQEASKKNSVEDSSGYCNCYSSYISEKYSDEKLNIAMNRPDVYEVVVKPAVSFCYKKFPIK